MPREDDILFVCEREALEPARVSRVVGRRRISTTAVIVIRVGGRLFRVVQDEHLLPRASSIERRRRPQATSPAVFAFSRLFSSSFLSCAAHIT